MNNKERDLKMALDAKKELEEEIAYQELNPQKTIAKYRQIKALKEILHITNYVAEKQENLNNENI